MCTLFCGGLSGILVFLFFIVHDKGQGLIFWADTVFHYFFFVFLLSILLF